MTLIIKQLSHIYLFTLQIQIRLNIQLIVRILSDMICLLKRIYSIISYLFQNESILITQDNNTVNMHDIGQKGRL